MDEQISVIVPVYKVEPYLPRCIESILSQTYSNLEIILVDDGSPDNCPAICDAYAQRDSRIRVIHKKNGGQSDARNAGMNIARGKYFAFIDSDDFVSPDYIVSLYSSLQKSGAEISAIGRRIVFEGESLPNEKQVESAEYSYDTKAAIRELLIMNISPEVSGKLFCAELFTNIRFPVGEIYEDLAIIFHLFLRAKHVTYSSQPLYQYFIRQGSTMQSPFDMRQYVEVRWIEEATALISQRFPELDQEIRGRCIWSYFKTLYRILCAKDRKMYRAQQDEMLCKIRQNARGLLFSNRIDRNLKIKIASLYFGRYGYYCVQKASDAIKQIKAAHRFYV